MPSFLNDIGNDIETFKDNVAQVNPHSFVTSTFPTHVPDALCSSLYSRALAPSLSRSTDTSPHRVLLVFLNTVRGQANTTQPGPLQQLVCHPFGECQPCPEDSVSNLKAGTLVLKPHSALGAVLLPFWQPVRSSPVIFTISLGTDI